MQRFQVSANYTPELRAAAKYLLDHPDDFKSLETADSKAQGFKGHADGKIGKGDTTAAMQQVSFSVGEKEALQTLAKYGNSFFTSGDKMVSKSDLDAIVKTGKMPDGTAAPQDMKDAAKLILSQPELFDKMDNAFKVRVKHRGDQRGDGLVSADDLREVLKGADTQPGPSGLKGEIFGNVRADSLAGLFLRGLSRRGLGGIRRIRHQVQVARQRDEARVLGIARDEGHVADLDDAGIARGARAPQPLEHRGLVVALGIDAGDLGAGVARVVADQRLQLRFRGRAVVRRPVGHR